MIPSEFLTTPIVYAVGKNYQIMVPVSCETVMWVKVGDQCFYDDSNGILRSACSTHRMTVPAHLLDKEKKYTVCYRVINERKPYFTDSGDELHYESAFRPIENEPVHIYHIADAHNRIDEPVSAGSYFGDKLDLLVLNGDIPNHSGKIEYFTSIHQIASQLTNGEIPVVFSRGNHDTRGIYAEKIADYTPTHNGRSYFTFRVGHVWGMVLDCGEDKCDANKEYGFTICCEDFRRRETEFIKDVIANAKIEYEADGVKNRVIICHVPFTEPCNHPFDIERELYAEWAKLLEENIHPQFMLSGHIHKFYVKESSSENADVKQLCPLIVASKIEKDSPFWGGALTLYTDKVTVEFTSSEGDVFVDKYNIVF